MVGCNAEVARYEKMKINVNRKFCRCSQSFKCEDMLGSSQYLGYHIYQLQPAHAMSSNLE
jgi:hypothetical protein